MLPSHRTGETGPARPLRSRLVLGTLSFALVGPTMPRSCESATVVEVPSTQTTGCPPERTIAGVCVGVPSGAICSSEVCTEGVACARTLQASDDASLAAAIAQATAGTCIALARGSYTDVALPGRVSLLGVGAAAVSVGSVQVAQGAGAVLRGFTAAGGIHLDGVTDARIESVRVTGSATDGIEVGAGSSSLSVMTSEITGAVRYGIGAVDSGDILVTTSLVQGAAGAGVWMACTDECDCAAAAALFLDKVVLWKNHRVGASIVGVAARLSDVRVANTTTDDSFAAGLGISASGCADLEAVGLTITGSSSNGVLIDKASARLGAEGAGRGAVVDHNVIGIWVQHVSTAEKQSVRLENCRVTANSAVGIGIAGQSSNVVIRSTEIEGTESLTLPSGQGSPGGSVDVGDGLVWLDHSFADIDGLSVRSSARASVLIDGQVATGSKLAHVTLAGGDETKGIVQQSCPSGGTAPESGPGTPPIQQTSAQTFPLPWN